MQSDITGTHLNLIIDELTQLTSISKMPINPEKSKSIVEQIQNYKDQNYNLLDLFMDTSSPLESPLNHDNDRFTLSSYLKNFHKMVLLYCSDELERISSSTPKSFSLSDFQQEIVQSIKALTIPLANSLSQERKECLSALTENKIFIEEAVQIAEHLLNEYENNSDELTSQKLVVLQDKLKNFVELAKLSFDKSINNIYEIDHFFHYRDLIMSNFYIARYANGEIVISLHDESQKQQKTDAPNFIFRSKQCLHESEIQALAGLREMKKFFDIEPEIRKLNLYIVKINNLLRHLN